MKKSRVYTRKRLALHWILLALVFLLVVNQLLGVCLLLPIQAAHRSADLQGIGRAHLVERRWEPEWRATGLLYLMGNENAIFITDTHLGPIGLGDRTRRRSGLHGRCAAVCRPIRCCL